METLIGLMVGAIVAGAIAVLVINRRNSAQVQTSDGALTRQDIEQTMEGVLNTALNKLSDSSRLDRDEAIALAAKQVANAGGDELGKRAELINTQLKQHQQSMDQQVNDLSAELGRLRELNVEKFGNVDNAVATLAGQTQALNNALVGTGSRGNWGERTLEDILTQSGFLRGIHYEKQEILEGGGKPDFSFFLPQERVVYLDSKFPLPNYQKYCAATDDAIRKNSRDAFIKNVEDRVKELEKRDYVNQSNKKALDYVLLFIPIEAIVTFIQETKPTLIDEARDKKVILCSPLSLYFYLAIFRQAVESFELAKNIDEVLKLLYSTSKIWRGYVKKLGGIHRAFEKMQTGLSTLTVGKDFKAMAKNFAEVENLAQAKAITHDVTAAAELEITFDELSTEAEDNLFDDDTDET